MRLGAFRAHCIHLRERLRHEILPLILRVKSAYRKILRRAGLNFNRELAALSRAAGAQNTLQRRELREHEHRYQRIVQDVFGDAA